MATDRTYLVSSDIFYGSKEAQIAHKCFFKNKGQSAELYLLKLAKKRNVCGQRYSEVTCASSLLNAGVDSNLVRLRNGNFQRQCRFRSEVYYPVCFGEFNYCTVTFNMSSK